MDDATIIVLCVISGLITGAFTATVANAKGYNRGTWFFAGFLFSLVALIAIVGMPELQEESLEDKLKSHQKGGEGLQGRSE